MVSIHNFFYRIEYASGRTPEVLREAVKYLKKAVCDEIMAQGKRLQRRPKQRMTSPREQGSIL